MIPLEERLDRLPLPRVALPAPAWGLLALAAAVLYGLALENGAVLRGGARVLHELFHDGRHFLGVPCH